MFFGKRSKTTRKVRKDRRLFIEHLETRALLSASPGISSVLGAHVAAGSYGSSGYGRTSTTVAAAEFAVAMPSQVQAGTLTAVTLTALGSNGRTATSYTGTIDLSGTGSVTFYASKSSTATAITSIAVTSNSTVTVYVDFPTTAAGTQTITATDSVTSSITGTGETVVAVPDVAAYYSMSLAPAVLTGATTTVQMVAYDANGFVDRSYEGTADLTTTATGVTFSATAVQFHNGYATFQVTFATAGTGEAIVATDSVNTSLVKTVSTNVVTDAATQYAISLSAVVRAGQPVTVQVYALDANGHVVTTYSGSTATASVTTSDTGTNVTVPSTIDFVKGVATFQITLVTSGQQTVTVSDPNKVLTSVTGYTEVATAGVSSWGGGGGWGGGGSGPGGSGTTGTGGSGTTGTGGSGSTGTGGSGTTGTGGSGTTGTGGSGTTGTGGSGSTGTGGSGSTTTAASNASVSTNWSGYAVQSSNGSVSAVSGTWTVPKVTGSGTGYSAVWVGIDGYNSSSVEQIGTEQDTDGTDYVWYEMYPAGSVTISSVTIKAGDTITASVTYSGGVYALSIKDVTTGKSFSINETASENRSSAEWIVEAPSENSVLPLANFGTVTFTNASATISGKTGSISTWTSTAIDMESSSGVLEATTSTLATGGAGFTVTYDSSGSSSGYGGGGGWGGGGYGSNFDGNQNSVDSQLAARDQLFGSGLGFLRV